MHWASVRSYEEKVKESNSFGFSEMTGCPALSACSLGVRATPRGHGRSLLPAVRAMGTTRTSYKRTLFPTVVPMVPASLVSWTRATGPL